MAALGACEMHRGAWADEVLFTVHRSALRWHMQCTAFFTLPGLPFPTSADRVDRSVSGVLKELTGMSRSALSPFR